MVVTVNWAFIAGRLDPKWDISRGLYAYLAPDGEEILNIGKVDGTTVRQRWNAPDKIDLMNDLIRQRGIEEVEILVGSVKLGPGMRHSIELLEDIESLLIHRIRPWGNRKCIDSRISRPGLRVRCTGQWGWEREYFDAGSLPPLRR